MSAASENNSSSTHGIYIYALTKQERGSGRDNCLTNIVSNILYTLLEKLHHLVIRFYMLLNQVMTIHEKYLNLLY